VHAADDWHEEKVVEHVVGVELGRVRVRARVRVRVRVRVRELGLGLGLRWRRAGEGSMW
jgi:hypothetical protein